MAEFFVKLNADLVAAMKAKDEFRLSVIRMMKSKILNVNARGDLPEAELIKIVNKYAKELKDSAEEYKKIGRDADVAQVMKELAIVQEYLPKELSADEVKALVQAAISETGATTIKDMGNVMKAVLAKAPGADGKIVSSLVRELLK